VLVVHNDNGHKCEQTLFNLHLSTSQEIGSEMTRFVMSGT